MEDLSPADKYEAEQENKERLEHRDVLLSIASIIKTPQGIKLFKYLFKSLDVLKLPDASLEDRIFYEQLGFLKAGKSIYELTCIADVESAARLLSQLERERYDDTIKRYRIEHELDTSTPYNNE